MDLSIIIVNYNGHGYIQACTQSLRRLGSMLRWEAVVVDNGSTDQSLDFLRALAAESPAFKLLEAGSNTGFAYAANMGAEQARGRFFIFLNPDTQLVDTNITKLINFYYQKAQHEKVGAVGVKLLNFDQTLQHNARSFPNLARQFYESFFLYRIQAVPAFSSYFLGWWDHQHVRKVDWLSGAFLFIKASTFFDAGGFDPRFFMYSEDTDLCLALARKGYSHYYFPHFTARHADGGIACRDMGTRLAQIWAARTAYFTKNFSRAYALAASLLYGLGMANRFLLYALAGNISKAKPYGRAIGYYAKSK